MSTCISYGWGIGPWGITPWVAGISGFPGGPLPSADPFDLYLVAPCEEMSYFLTYDTVSSFTSAGGLSTQFFVHSDQSTCFASGAGYPEATAWVQISTNVPATSTAQWTMTLYEIPNDFNDVANRHVYLGTSDASSTCWGLLFSDIGVRYVGAAHHDIDGLLVLDSGVLTIPNSDDWIELGVPWTWKVVVDTTTNAMYLYADPAEDVVSGGGTLRAILPLFMADDLLVTPTDQSIFSFKGIDADPVLVGFHSLGLGTGHIAPEYPPVADPGPDQAIQLCQIVQLDGTASFDPEGAPLTYQWRLIDAPQPSGYVFEGNDGVTLPDSPATGFTARFYSPELADEDAIEEVSVGVMGDVLIQGVLALTIVAKGTDGNGFYVDVESESFVDNLNQVPFRLIRQLAMSNPTNAKPTFYPDVAGVFKFDLRVFDGLVYSPRAKNLLNVVEVVLARGVTPDLSFIWKYLPDSWSLVDETEHVDLMWSALAQVVASELFYLWQVDYSKSLRDVQRTICRKWLHFEPYAAETLPSFTEVKSSLCDVYSNGIPNAGIAVGGTSVTVENLLSGVVTTATFAAGGPYSAAYVRGILHNMLGGAGYEVNVTVNRVPPAGAAATYISVQASFPFEITGSVGTLFGTTATRNSLASGSGIAKGSTSFLADRSFEHLDLSNKYLVIAGVGYRIDRAVDDAADPLPYQTLQLSGPIGTLTGASWRLATTLTSKTFDFIKSLAAAGDVAELQASQEDVADSITVQVPVLGYVANEVGVLLVDTWEAENILRAPFTTVFTGFYRRSFLPVQPLVKSVPLLQDKVRNATEASTLRHNVDFYMVEERGVPAIRFESTAPKDVWEGAVPPKTLWAEYVYIDNSPVIEGNFGKLVSFSLDDLAALDNDMDYLSAVQGLWYVHLNGPSLFNIRVGTQILLGLPFAEVAGTIIEIRSDYGATQGRILLQDSGATTVRSYTYPVALTLETNPKTGRTYEVGDVVDAFEPLVQGVEVVDYVKDPNWTSPYVQQGLFFEIEKFFRFLVRIDSPAFSLSSLSFVQSFVRRINPAYTQPLHVVLRQIGDAEISVTDEIAYGLQLRLFDGSRTRSYDGTPYGGSMWGVATMFDEPDPARGGWRSQFDTSSDPNAPVPEPGDVDLTEMGFDRALFHNEMNITGNMEAIEAAPFMPTVDSVFRVDSEIMSDADIHFTAAEVFWLRADGIVFPQLFVAVGAHTIDRLQIDIKGWTAVSGTGITIELFKNAVLAATHVVVPPDSGSGTYFDLAVAPPVAVANNDQFTVKVTPVSGTNYECMWRQVLLNYGESVPWYVDMDGVIGPVALAAGSYYSRRIM